MGQKGGEEGTCLEQLAFHCGLLLQVGQALPLLLTCLMSCKETQQKEAQLQQDFTQCPPTMRDQGPGRGARTETPPTLVLEGCFVLPSKVEKGAGQLARGAASFAQWGRRALWGKKRGSCPRGARRERDKSRLADPRGSHFLAGGSVTSGDTPLLWGQLGCCTFFPSWPKRPRPGPSLGGVLTTLLKGRNQGVTAQSLWRSRPGMQSAPPFTSKKGGAVGSTEKREKGLGASQESPPAKEAQPLRSEQGLRLAQADLWKAEPKRAKGLGLPHPCPTSSLTPLLDQDGPSRPCPKPCWGSASQSHGSSGTFAPALS